MGELLMLLRPDLRDEVGRCAVAAGYSAVVGDLGDDAGGWLRADAVVVDADAVERLAGAGAIRRHAVFLVYPPDASPRVWRDALDVGVSDGFELPADEERLVAALTELALPVRADGRVLAILGGHGGAGATTLAAASGLSAASGEGGRNVLVISPDEAGVGIDLVLGVEDVPGPRVGDLAAVGGRLNQAALREALPRVGALSVLAVAADGRAIRPESVLAAVDAGRAGGDVVVVDVPRTHPALRREVVRRADLVVLLSQAMLPAIAATRATRVGLVDPRGPVELVLRGPAPGGLPVGEMAWAVGTPLLGSYRSDPSLPSRMEGRPLRLRRRGPLAAIAARICDRLDEAVPS